MTEFWDELEALINKYSMENTSNTPDFILAQYLVKCLEAFNTAVQERDKWYSRDLTVMEEKIQEAIGEYSATVMEENPHWVFDPVPATKLANQILAIFVRR